MHLLKQSVQTNIIVGPVLDAAGLYVSVTLSALDFKVTKNGTVVSMNANNSVSYDHNGHYLITLSTNGTADTNTVGRLVITMANPLYAMAMMRFEVLPYQTYEAIVENAAGGLNGLPLSYASNKVNAVVAGADCSGTFPETTKTALLPAEPAGAANGLRINGTNTGATTFGATTFGAGVVISNSTGSALKLTPAANGSYAGLEIHGVNDYTPPGGQAVAILANTNSAVGMFISGSGGISVSTNGTGLDINSSQGNGVVLSGRFSPLKINAPAYSNYAGVEIHGYGDTTLPSNQAIYVSSSANEAVKITGSTGVSVVANYGNALKIASSFGNADVLLNSSGTIANAGGTAIGNVALLATQNNTLSALVSAFGLDTATPSNTPPLKDLAVGTAANQGGNNNQITLDSGAVAADNYYVGQTIRITSGTGVGQSRVITAYTIGKVATVSPNWSSVALPTSGGASKYAIGPAVLSAAITGFATEAKQDPAKPVLDNIAAKAVTLPASPASTSDVHVIVPAPQVTIDPQAPSAVDNAAAVWGYLVASADALGVTKMGGWVRTILNNVLNVISTSPIHIRNLIDAGGSMRIVTADDYPAGRAIQFGIPDTFMSLTGSVPKLAISKSRGGIPTPTPAITFTGALLTGSFVINGVTYTRIIQFTPTATQTALLTDWSPNAYLYTVRAVWTSPAQTITLVTPSPCTALW